MTHDPVTITRVTAEAYRVPIARSVDTSFGRMTDRPAVFLRVEDADGCFGWGEVFANWPAAGAEHRVNLLERDIAPLVIGQTVRRPEELFHRLTEQTNIRAHQCREEGPFQQVIAGLDIALWDLFARRAGVPLRHMLAGDAEKIADSVPAYASGIDIRRADELIPEARAAGNDTFKVKVGFSQEDAAALRRISAGLRDGERLCADANQAWTLNEAEQFLDAIRDTGLFWLEEPIPAYASERDWHRLAEVSAVPLAGGENVSGHAPFRQVIAAGHLDVLQPDVAKWGGLTGCRSIALAAMAAGRLYCPHYLGGGIGLLASAELLAAVGGEGLLELDVNPNPLREAFLHGSAKPDLGTFVCGTAPGLGIESLPREIAPFRTCQVEVAERIAA